MKNKNRLDSKLGQFFLTLRTILSQGEILDSSIVIAYYVLFSLVIENLLPPVCYCTTILLTGQNRNLPSPIGQRKHN